MIHKQLNQRQVLQDKIDKLKQQHEHETKELKQKLFSKMPDDKVIKLQNQLKNQFRETNTTQRSNGLEIDL